MEFFKTKTNIDFMGQRRITAFVSVMMVVVSLCFLFTKGLNFGLDFTGGAQIEVRFAQTLELDKVRDALDGSSLAGAKVTYFGSTEDVLIRESTGKDISEGALKEELAAALDGIGKFEIRRVDFVGSEVGAELAEKGAMAVIIAIIATMIYIAMRFEYRFAVSAAVALMHDPLVILGFFAASQIEFDLPTLASVLAVLGYSLNDTIVVFDRVRENFRSTREENTSVIMNDSINQTLSRTIMTSLLTLLVVVALVLFGGASLLGFSVALLIGIVVGTYSSIYIAGALAVTLGLKREDMLPPQPATDEV